MSHELKHPLNLINVNAELLMRLPEAQALPAVQRAAATIRRTVQSQARIIDDLLDMSRTNTGKLAVNRVPLLLGEAIQPCMAWALAEARSKGVRLYAEGLAEPVLIDGDPVRVEQIAWNLLSNAIKFTRSGGSVTVRLSHDDEEALLEVIDTGRGIAPAFLPQVFEMFRQADAATTRDEGGLGIGLALVKSLVELHGGRVAAESAGRGEGTTMRVWLPMHQRTEFGELDEAAAKSSRGEPSPAPRVLLVDDTARHARDLRLPARARGRAGHAGEQRRGGAGAGRDRGLRPGDLRRRHAGHGRLPDDRRDAQAARAPPACRRSP